MVSIKGSPRELVLDKWTDNLIYVVGGVLDKSIIAVDEISIEDGKLRMLIEKNCVNHSLGLGILGLSTAVLIYGESV
jgi:predicted RNA-binding protein